MAKEEIRLPDEGKSEKKESKDTRLESFCMSTRHLPEAKNWTAGESYDVSFKILFTGLRESYRDDGEQEAEMLILPRKKDKGK